MFNIETIKSMMVHLGLSRKTVKAAVKDFLMFRYYALDINGPKVIGIDEFDVRIDYEYKTIVVDMETGRIV